MHLVKHPSRLYPHTNVFDIEFSHGQPTNQPTHCATFNRLKFKIYKQPDHFLTELGHRWTLRTHPWKSGSKFDNMLTHVQTETLLIVCFLCYMTVNDSSVQTCSFYFCESALISLKPVGLFHWGSARDGLQMVPPTHLRVGSCSPSLFSSLPPPFFSSL